MTHLDMQQDFYICVFYSFPSVISLVTLRINVMCW